MEAASGPRGRCPRHGGAWCGGVSCAAQLRRPRSGARARLGAGAGGGREKSERGEAKGLKRGCGSGKEEGKASGRLPASGCLGEGERPDGVLPAKLLRRLVLRQAYK